MPIGHVQLLDTTRPEGWLSRFWACPLDRCLDLGQSGRTAKLKGGWHGTGYQAGIGGNELATRQKAKPMAEQKFKPSVKLANAISMMMEQDPADWGAGEHCTMLRYLVLQCSDKASFSVEAIKALPKGTKVAVDLTELATVLYETGKLAECANFKKFLTGGDYPNLGKKAETKYA